MEPIASQRCLLRVSNVSKSFGALRALAGVDIAVAEGSIHGIIGPNGSGKTTLFNCVTGQLRADSGTVHLDGTDITRDRADVIARRGIRRTFQAGKTVPGLTVLENVMGGINDGVGRSAFDIFFRLPFARSARETEIETRARETLEMVGMSASADRFAADLVWTERQLVQIARALIAKPRLLLMDEPASGMGSREIDAVEEIINRIRDTGVTVVVVSHDVKMLMNLSETVTVLNFGEKIAEGTPDEVRANPRVLEAYLGAD